MEQSQDKKWNGLTVSPGDALLLLVVLGWLWGILTFWLWPDSWSGFGWAVPFACGFLVWKKYNAQLPARPVRPFAFRLSNFSFYSLLVFLALLYAALRLVEPANHEWRLIGWMLAMDVVGFTLLLVYFVLGGAGLKQFSFPILFILLAVPWPTVVEAPMIHWLTQVDGAVAKEVLSWLGISATPHGHVMVLANGPVRIDDSCSGIRSIQTVLMLALFAGEWYQLNLARRAFVVFGGMAIAFGLNLIRISALLWVAAQYGFQQMAWWHSPASIIILLLCFFSVWFLSKRLVRLEKEPSPSPAVGVIGLSDLSVPKSLLTPLLLSLVVWFAMVEIEVGEWYRSHLLRPPPAKAWTFCWPTNDPTCKTGPIPERARRNFPFPCDQGNCIIWADGGILCQAVHLRWNPGRLVGHPQIFRQTTSGNLQTIAEPMWFEVNGVRLPFNFYAVKDASKPMYVFYGLWDECTGLPAPAVTLDYRTRLAFVRDGLLYPAVCSLEIVLTGQLDERQAEVAFRKRLAQIVRSKPASVQTAALK